MNLNVTLRLNPADYGKSGELAVCVFCAKATEYKICCDSYKGLLPLDLNNVHELCDEYSFTVEQRKNLVKDIIKFLKEGSL